ncbi:hypothetical protein NN561_018322 [Cricetulus griseus]
MTSVPGGFRLPRRPLPSCEPRESSRRLRVRAAGAEQSGHDTRRVGQSPPAPTPGQSLSGPPKRGCPQDPDGRTLRLRGSGLYAAPARAARAPRAPRTPGEDKGRELDASDTARMPLELLWKRWSWD